MHHTLQYLQTTPPLGFFHIWQLGYNHGPHDPRPRSPEVGGVRELLHGWRDGQGDPTRRGYRSPTTIAFQRALSAPVLGRNAFMGIVTGMGGTPEAEEDQGSTRHPVGNRGRWKALGVVGGRSGQLVGVEVVVEREAESGLGTAKERDRERARGLETGLE